METQAAGPLAVEGPDRAQDKATMRSPEEAAAGARAALGSHCSSSAAARLLLSPWSVAHERSTCTCRLSRACVW